MKWHDAVAGISAENKTVDLLPTAARSPEREKLFGFTKDYLSFPRVIFARNDATYGSLLELHGRKVAVEKNFITEKLLQKDHPEIDLEVVATSRQAMEAVSFGNAEAYVGNLAVGSFLIEKHGLANLKVAARTNYKFDTQAMGVRKDWPELAALIDKALAALPETTHQALRQRWLPGVGDFKAVAGPAGVAPTDTTKLVVQVGGGIIALVTLLLVMALVVQILGDRDTSRLYESRQVKGIGMVLIGLFLVVVVLAAWFTVERTERQTREETGESLRTIVRTTHEALRVWLDSQRHELHMIARNTTLRTVVEQLLEVPRRPEQLRQSPHLAALRAHLADEMKRIGKLGFFVIARDGISVASLRDSNVGSRNLIAEKRGEFLERVFQGETLALPPMASDVPLKNAQGELVAAAPTMFFAAPVKNAAGRIIAAITLRIDAGRKLER